MVDRNIIYYEYHYPGSTDDVASDGRLGDKRKRRETSKCIHPSKDNAMKPIILRTGRKSNYQYKASIFCEFTDRVRLNFQARLFSRLRKNDNAKFKIVCRQFKGGSLRKNRSYRVFCKKCTKVKSYSSRTAQPIFQNLGSCEY